MSTRSDAERGGRTRAVLAYDLGSTSLRAGLVAADGRLLAMAVLPQETPSDERGWSEQDPETWWHDAAAVTADLLRQETTVPADIVALALGGITRTQIFLDADGRPVRPAITWRDGRAAAEGQTVAAARDAVGVAAYGPVNAFHPLARLLWVKAHDPQAFARTRCVLHPKDLIGFRLTGHTAGDALSWSGVLSAETGKLAQGWLDALALPGDLVPPIRPPQAILGPVRAALAPPFDRLAGRPVIVGAMDTWCATLGAGAIAPERAYNVSGTSEVSGFLTRTPRAVPGLITLPWSDGLFQIGGPSQSGGDCLAWFARAFATDAADRVDTLLADLARTPRQPEAILFLPYLSGERAPIWEPDARAVFFGLTARHGRVDLLWSVLEGVAFAVRDVLDRATDGDLARIDEVRIAGGGARHDPWCQIKADVLGRPLRRAASPEPGLVGAAALAFLALGDFPDLAAAQAAMTGVERSFNPDAERHRHYSALFERFRALQAVAIPQARALVAALRRD